MLFASTSTVVQAGFVIGTGLLLDTFIVRTITVPAIAVLVGKANWWPSKLPPPTPREHPVRPAEPDSQPASTGTADGLGASATGRHARSDSETAALHS
jgi:putative drug exporter of the RND superfamily